MKTYHIHISGLVQGVGFRPYVYQIAEEKEINGWVCNSKDGVHIEFNAAESAANELYAAIIQSPPANAMITSHSIIEISSKKFSSFTIKKDMADTKPGLLLTPDFAICESCRKEILDTQNRRYHYPFTTCLHCGPRYSIIKQLPYERHYTSMSEFTMCSDCNNEYNDVNNQRHYSQTNSCPGCAIPMHLYDAAGQLLSNDSTTILNKLNELLIGGYIAAVKGIGGYLLLCDAGNETAIQHLRHRKNRPVKPFALLYPDVESAKSDTFISASEESLLKDQTGPIVLCRLKPASQNKICTEIIAPGLDKIGLMLPCSPLLQLVATTFGKPLIATSANISGSPIIYKDEDAFQLLKDIADYIISYDRDIMMPQDDSVLQVSNTGTKIVLRRSRGLAPNYFPNPFKKTGDCILAMGGELKCAFALQDQQYLYVSQYLGNQENPDSQLSFTHTVNHLLDLLQIKPSLVLADNHPGYFVTQLGTEMALNENIPLITIQHHKAHFGAVLAENNLLHTNDPVLGIIWDGAGYGDDQQIWGGEFLIYENHEMHRVAQLEYFPQLLGDKMSREPRLSALSLLKFLPSIQQIIRPQFSEQEWQFYQQLLKHPAELLTSSIGRLLDGIASILGVCHINTYEGEAAMKLEAIARSNVTAISDYYPVPLKNNRLDFSWLLHELKEDIDRNKTTGFIAKKVFYSLAMIIGLVSEHMQIDRIAFSGGVFQNALLTDMIAGLFGNKKQLYWHQQLSPNDECIGFGQLACYHIMQEKDMPMQVAESVCMSELMIN